MPLATATCHRRRFSSLALLPVECATAAASLPSRSWPSLAPPLRPPRAVPCHLARGLLAAARRNARSRRRPLAARAPTRPSCRHCRAAPTHELQTDFSSIREGSSVKVSSRGHKLGEGGFGSVYKGYLKETSHQAVAIKRVSKGSKQGRKEYASEVRIISRLRHRNLVQLIGWCHGGGELLLVYELMPNGNLDAHLHHDHGPTLLPWPLRHEIVLGLGSALLYLHQELVDHGRGSHTTVLAGTMGYMDPECMVTGRANDESDVYSFSVVLLEIASGQRPMVPNGEYVIHLVQWVWESYGKGAFLGCYLVGNDVSPNSCNGLGYPPQSDYHTKRRTKQHLDVADRRLNGEFNASEMETVMIVGLWCAHPDRRLRPSIRQAMNMLRSEVPLPSLPPRMPVATFMPPPDAFYYTSSVATGRTSSTGTGTTQSSTTETTALLK
ncbi:hypothetical protein EJB05_00465, partial [Eragrostis curvula]